MKLIDNTITQGMGLKICQSHRFIIFKTI